MNEAMNMLLPMIYQRCVLLMPDASEVAVLLQKQILKIFFALVQYFLPLNLIPKDVFSQWMEIFRAIVGRPVPEVNILLFKIIFIYICMLGFSCEFCKSASVSRSISLQIFVLLSTQE